MNPLKLNQYSKTLFLQISLYGIHAYSGVTFIAFICNLELQLNTVIGKPQAKNDFYSLQT